MAPLIVDSLEKRIAANKMQQQQYHQEQKLSAFSMAPSSVFFSSTSIKQLQLNGMALSMTRDKLVKSMHEDNDDDKKKESTSKPLKNINDEAFELVEEGEDVYVQRYSWITGVLMMLNVWVLLQHIQDVKLNVVAAIATYLYYDLFSGIVHVVLDEPTNLRGWRSLAVKQPCLEFQWHHIIPHDIAVKGWFEACSDLNGLLVGLTVIHLLAHKAMATKVGCVVTGWRLLWAFYGQFSHMTAHQGNISSSKDKSIGTTLSSELLKLLQRSSLILPPSVHKYHHYQDHDDNYCLIGWCNGVMWSMRHRVTTNPTAWFFLLLSLFLFDVPVIINLVDKLHY